MHQLSKTHLAFSNDRSALLGSRRTAYRPARLPCCLVRSEASQQQKPHNLIGDLGRALTVGLLSFAAVNAPVAYGPPQIASRAEAKLTAGDPIKNAKAILRYALPIDNKPIRDIQRNLEAISESLRIPGNKSLGPVTSAVRSAYSILKDQRAAILADVADEKQEDALQNIANLEDAIGRFRDIIDAKDKQEVPIIQQECLNYVGRIQEDMVKAFPFEIPAEYRNKPLLLGRASLDMVVHCKETQEGERDVDLQIVVDGYNAPVSAGNFVDLVQRKFYDGMEIQRADGFVVQTGDPEGPAEGFVDPATGEIRRVPIEIRVVGDKVPVYELSLEDLGRFNEQPVLPFNAYGTMAMARGEFENNSASSQIFFLLKESELTPSSANLLDGRYAVFGYVVQGQDTLGQMKVGDVIKYIKVVDGGQYLVNGPKSKPAPAPAPAAVEEAPVDDVAPVEEVPATV